MRPRRWRRTTAALIAALALPALAAAAWDWEACTPEALRTAVSVERLRNPFALLTSSSEALDRSTADRPPEVEAEVLRLTDALRACVPSPAPWVLLGTRLHRPGDDLERPRASSDSVARARLRTVLEQVDATGVTFAIWSPERAGGFRRHEVRIAAPAPVTTSPADATTR